jgi:hypothetical protein
MLITLYEIRLKNIFCELNGIFLPANLKNNSHIQKTTILNYTTVKTSENSEPLCNQDNQFPQL